jgi:integrase
VPGGGSRWDTRFDHDRIRATLRAALTHTVNEDELISRNVAAMIRLPSGRVRKPRAWSVTEACQFLESARASSDPLYTGYVLMLVLGLRLGEMLGLPWANVNLEAAEVDVGWQLQRAGRHLYHRETKTPGSDAPLPLPSICAAAIKLQTEKQATWRHHAGQAWRDHGLVITTRYGTPYEPAISPGTSPDNATPPGALHHAAWYAPYLRLAAGGARCASSGCDADTSPQQDHSHPGDLHRGSRSGCPRRSASAGRAI